MRRFDSVPRLSFIFNELRRYCNKIVTSVAVFALFLGLGFALGCGATCLVVQAVIFDQAGLFCALLLICWVSGAACVWMGIPRESRPFSCAGLATQEESLSAPGESAVELEARTLEQMESVRSALRAGGGAVFFPTEEILRERVRARMENIGSVSPHPGQPGAGTRFGGRMAKGVVIADEPQEPDLKKKGLLSPAEWAAKNEREFGEDNPWSEEGRK